MTRAPDKLRVGIVGGTGYAGAELLRFLAAHPAVEVVAITSRSEEGQAVTCIRTCEATLSCISPHRMLTGWRPAMWCSLPRPTMWPCA